MTPEHIAVTITGREIEHGECEKVAPLLQRVGDKWSVLIVMILALQPRRFNELKRLINGISQRMLTLNLRSLERDGLLTRTVFPTIPPRVEYALTDLGRSLCVPVTALGQWANDNLREIEKARHAYDEKLAAED